MLIGKALSSNQLITEKPFGDGDESLAEILNQNNNATYRTFAPSDTYVRALGRTAFDGQRRLLSHSGSGVEFYCRSEYAKIVLSPAEDKYILSNKLPRIAIFVDGKQVEDILLSGRTSITVSTAEWGSTVRIIKLSEGMYSAAAVDEISVFSKRDIVPTDKKELSIEFIGDSMTCGYGIDAGESGSFSTATENFTKTYAYLTAERLDADCSAVCYSGYGVYSGFTGNGRRNAEALVPLHYEKSLHYTEDYLWDFGAADNDIVVINLGTNDASFCLGNSFRKLSFAQAYTDFLGVVREKNPDAYILCVLGDMNNSLFPAIEKAVEDFRLITGDMKVSAFTVDFKMGENPIVIDGHPGAESNETAAESLAAEIRRILGGKP